MDVSSALLILAAVIFFLVTLPLLAVATRLKHITRVLQRIESMNLRSLQRWP